VHRLLRLDRQFWLSAIQLEHPVGVGGVQPVKRGLSGGCLSGFRGRVLPRGIRVAFLRTVCGSGGDAALVLAQDNAVQPLEGLAIGDDARACGVAAVTRVHVVDVVDQVEAVADGELRAFLDVLVGEDAYAAFALGVDHVLQADAVVAAAVVEEAAEVTGATRVDGEFLLHVVEVVHLHAAADRVLEVVVVQVQLQQRGVSA